MRIGFIGSGSMASAIAVGASAKDFFKESLFLFSSAHGESAEACANAVGGTSATNQEIAQKADIIILAVKPHIQSAVIQEIRGIISGRNPQPCIVSIAAGRTLSSIAQDFDVLLPLVRVMPNVNARISQSISGICCNKATSEADFTHVRRLFDAVGRTEVIEEDHFDIFAALAGCSPAWIFQIIDSLARAGVKHGLSKTQATSIAAQALAGSALLALKELPAGTIPAALIDSVTSPGGTTIAGLLAAENAGLSSALIAAVDAAVVRDHELA